MKGKPSRPIPGPAKPLWKLHASSPTEQPTHTVQHKVDRVLHKKYFVIIPDGTPPVPPYNVPYEISKLEEFHQDGTHPNTRHLAPGYVPPSGKDEEAKAAPATATSEDADQKPPAP